MLEAANQHEYGTQILLSLNIYMPNQQGHGVGVIKGGPYLYLDYRRVEKTGINVAITTKCEDDNSFQPDSKSSENRHANLELR